ncbi:MAG: ABC transporter ATP-binding protein [Acidimicrobiales bacterium]
MTTLVMEGVHAGYEPTAAVVSDLTLTVASGERLVLLGPSGCGKTSTLRIIAGLLAPRSGDVRFDGQSVLAVPPEARGVAMVFQEPALIPFRSVAENVEYGLKLRKVNKAKRRTLVAEALDAVQLSNFTNRWPAELSGGQRQRVAIARALIVEPRLLLLDEPLSSLDPNLREDLGQMICDLQRRMGITTVMVTHDRAEADVVADRIGVMIDGHLRQVGRPAEIRNHPADDEVARFLGLPTMCTKSSTAAAASNKRPGL